jgi:hypothetical protein
MSDGIADEMRTVEDEGTLVPALPPPVRQSPQPLELGISSGEPLGQIRP